MIFQIEPSVAPDDAAVFRRALSRYPDDYKVLVSRPRQNLYIFHVERGQHGLLCRLRTDGGPLDKYQQEITEWGMKAIGVISDSAKENPRLVRENEVDKSMDQYVQMRLDDFRRYLTESQIEEGLEKGLLPGLEEVV